MSTRPSAHAPVSESILRLIKASGMVRCRDVKKLGVSHRHLYRMVDAGLLRRVSRGIYRLAHAEPTAHETLLAACKKAPAAVVCLLSALQFHGLTTQLPREVWLMIHFKARPPRDPHIPMRIMLSSGKALTAGIEKHKADGIEIRVYSAAKTVVDCFKYRNKIGLDVAIEALRDGLRRKKVSRDDLYRYGEICRMNRVMRPYLEALS